MSNTNGGAATTAPPWYLVPLGQAEFMPPGMKNLTEIDIHRPVAHQLTHISRGHDIVPIVPDDMPHEAANMFLTACYQGAMSYRMTQNTFHALAPAWIYNSLENAERFKACTPVDKITKTKDKAVIIGGGPSVNPDLLTDDFEIYCAWNAARKVVDGGKTPDYVGHADPNYRDGYLWDLPQRTKLIAMPQAPADFVNIPRELVGYFDPSNPAGAWFAQHHNRGDHFHVVGTVAHMLTHAAIYAGHTEIYLMGVDYAWVEGDYDSAEGCEIKEYTNQHGIKVKTYSVFETCAHGFFSTLVHYPDVKIYQTSKTALDIPGVLYKSLEVTNGDNTTRPD